MNRPNLFRTVVTGVAASAVTYTLISVPMIHPKDAHANDASQTVNPTGNGHDHAAMPASPAASSKAGDETKFVTKYTCPMHPQIIEDHPGTCPICGMNLVPKLFPVKVKPSAAETATHAVATPQAQQQMADDHSAHDHSAMPSGTTASAKSGAETKFVTKYTCPMHPQIIEDHPGTCPICGMNLVPKLFPVKVKPSAAETATQAVVTPQAQQQMADDHSAHDHSGHDHTALPSGTTASAKSGSETKFVTKYTCPMHPQIIEDHPGTCPICGMTLVPKLFPADTKDSGGQAQPQAQAAQPTVAAPAAQETLPPVAVAPMTLKYMNVVLAPVQWRNLTRQIHSVGLVGFDENRISHVHPRASGWVETLNVRALGDTVKKGEVLLTVYSPDILAAEKDYLVAAKSGMPALRDAALERLRLLSVPESIIKQIADTGRVTRTIPITAPQSGYISAINLREGMYITPTLDLFTIADPGKVWVQAEILERDMQQVAVGQPAEMTVDGIPGRIWHGKVDFVYPELDPKSRTLKARLVFDNPDGVLKPNQFAEIGISGVSQGDVLTVPSTAVIPTASGARVVRKNADGTFQPVHVQLGDSAGGYTQITHGLSPNDVVVASGQFLIDSESNVQAAFARMTGAVDQPAQ
ncbi:hypothetical protein A9404_08365 [Halothiobacillus diazotrophicus]|uniref:Uncharacterized protein n=1 Tax=Halothiobacillus diazotrophicus TaxID=1860122 RepID=A0A191ZHS0_9GAMM|nr:efflux RND transporter periplasmic adaptor subunit [Halothiobacillus diazotrophicus]ANJ67393.1 hypothetical protein A9404_08365 [Halothiobacillus diazotrophicus]